MIIFIHLISAAATTVSASDLSSSVSVHSDETVLFEPNLHPTIYPLNKNTTPLHTPSAINDVPMKNKVITMYLERSKTNDKLFVIKPKHDIIANYSCLPSKTKTAAYPDHVNKVSIQLSAIKRIPSDGSTFANNIATNKANMNRRTSICQTSQLINSPLPVQTKPNICPRIKVVRRRQTLHSNNLSDINNTQHSSVAMNSNLNLIVSNNNVPTIIGTMSCNQIEKEHNKQTVKPFENNQDASTSVTPSTSKCHAITLKGVKILTVNELNSRVEKLLPQNDVQNIENSTEKEVTAPIHVSLIKRASDELDLTFSMNEKTVQFEKLTDMQRLEVQRSLLDDNVWLKMLEHIKLGKPSPRSLSLFRVLLPSNEANHFFSQLRQNQNENSMRKNIVI